MGAGKILRRAVANCDLSFKGKGFVEIGLGVLFDGLIGKQGRHFLSESESAEAARVKILLAQHLRLHGSGTRTPSSERARLLREAATRESKAGRIRVFPSDSTLSSKS